MKMNNDNENLLKLAALIASEVEGKNGLVVKCEVGMRAINKSMPLFLEQAKDLFIELGERRIINRFGFGDDEVEPVGDTVYPTPNSDIVFMFEVAIPMLKRMIESPNSEFNEHLGVIAFGDKECPIEPLSKQYHYCKAMFGRPYGEWVAIDELFEATNGAGAEIRNKSNEKEISDALRAINRKATECFQKGSLFEQQKGMFRRLF